MATDSKKPIGIIGRVFRFAILLFVVILVARSCGTHQAVAPSITEAPTKSPVQASPAEPSKPLVTLAKYGWYRSGFDSIMMANFTIKNDSDADVKDIEITCTGDAQSGTQIDRNTRTIYQTIPAHKTKTIRNFNMGFINSQVTNDGCEIGNYSPSK